MILKILGVLLIILGAGAVAVDLIHGGNGWPAFGALWFQLAPASLNLAQAVIQRYLLPALWDPAILTLLLWPAPLVLAVPGLALLLLGLRRSRGGQRG
ncbi:MAG: hypothetical protein GC191_20795 [Azospirillum sp.]|nr:hypothetical protein [Azospirillum sp.]